MMMGIDALAVKSVVGLVLCDGPLGHDDIDTGRQGKRWEKQVTFS